MCSFASDFDYIQSEDIKHIWYFELILDHILFSFVMNLTHLIYNVQLFFVYEVSDA